MCDSTNCPRQDDTHFAPAARAGDDELRQHIEAASKNPVIDGILRSVHGLLAVLNPQRQILAVNDALLHALGIEEANAVLGLRPGEAVRCLHAHEEPGGCGTSQLCSTCGAAIAIVTSLATNEVTERECVVAAEKDGKEVSLYFQVRCCPVIFDGERFLLLFLRDISVEQHRAALEHVFYHDVSNLVDSLVVNSRLLTGQKHEGETGELAEQIRELTARLAAELRIQKAIARGPGQYELSVCEFPLRRVIGNLEMALRHHPAAKGKTLVITPLPAELELATDPYLLERVLTNMLMNAFEATREGGEVKLWVEDESEGVAISVWNQRQIPEDVARRLFQHHFTTKPGSGRGLGTYAMKLLGETYMQGKVGFTTSETKGTVFRLWLPKQAPRNEMSAR